MHFYLLLRPIVSLVVIHAFIALSQTQSVPHVRPELQSPVVRPVGANVHLPCPVYDDGSGFMFYEWSREDGHQLDPFSTPRIRYNDKRVLKIKSAVVSDSGVYRCKAINGFGFVLTSVTLKIVPTEDFKAANPPLDNQYPLDNYPRDDNYLVMESDTNDHSTKVVSSPIIKEKEVGSFVVLDCSPETATKGHWFKNGNRLYQKRKDSLTVRNLKLEDSGSYSCLSRNGLQEVNNTYVLRVFDNNQKPEMKEFTPINSTVVLGDKAVFHCKVYSEVIPQIQWLKSFNDVRDGNEAIHMGLVDSQRFPGLHLSEKYYQVIKTGKAVDEGNGIYYNNLVINKTALADSGNYVCMVATTVQGHFNIIHKSTYLKVIKLSEDKSSHLSSRISNWIITSVVLFIFSGLLLAILCRYCLRNKFRSEPTVQDSVNRQKGADIEQMRIHQRNYYFPESVHNSCYSYGLETIHLNTECSDYMSSSERDSYKA